MPSNLDLGEQPTPTQISLFPFYNYKIKAQKSIGYFLEQAVLNHDRDQAPAQCCQVLQIATTAELARKETPKEIYEKQPLKFNDRVMYRKAVLNEQTTEYDQQDEYFYYNESPGF